MGETTRFTVSRAIVSRPSTGNYLLLFLQIPGINHSSIPPMLELEVYLSNERGMETLREDNRQTSGAWLIIEMKAVCPPSMLLPLVQPNDDCAPQIDRLALVAGAVRIALPKRASGAFGTAPSDSD